MRNRAIHPQSILAKRKAALRRWRDYRLYHFPVCHIAVADDDFALFKPETIISYRIKHGVEPVPLSALSAHKAHCKRNSTRAA